MTEFPSFLCLIHIPLHVYTAFCLSIHLSMDIWAASTSWLLWIMLQWTWLCKYLFEALLSIHSDIYPEKGLLDHMVVLFLIFWGASILFSIVVAPFFIPTNSAQGFQFLHILVNTYYFYFFDSSHPNGCEVISHYDFDLCFSNLMMLSIFLYACWSFVYHLWRNVRSSPLPIFNWVICFFIIELQFFTYSAY